MLYAQVVLGLPVEGPFDYIVPDAFAGNIRPGGRVWVPFGRRRMVGYVVKLAKSTSIKKLKQVSALIDHEPLLDESMVMLAKRLSAYYCCSFGQAIETMLPAALRKGRPVKAAPCERLEQQKGPPQAAQEALLVEDLSRRARWEIYLDKIKSAFEGGRSTIILEPDKNCVMRAGETVNSALGIKPLLAYRGHAGELDQWLKIKAAAKAVVVGMRSSIFSPVNNLGLIIVDEEFEQSYKQEQVPHYNAREVASMRAGMQKTGLILGATQPSLESYLLAKKERLKRIIMPVDGLPEVKICDDKPGWAPVSRKPSVISKYLQDSISSVLDKQGTVLLLLDRKGFATYAHCKYCGKVLKCSRCSANLAYYFKENTLLCHYCNSRTAPPSICPECNSSYIRYSGLGTEKIESELARLFPQAKESDITISTRAVLSKSEGKYDLTCVLGADNSLNRVDFRAAEKTYQLLCGLLRLTRQRLIIQTAIAGHHCFKAIKNADFDGFYAAEIRHRRQLGFPPYKHMGLVKLRGRREETVKEAASGLFGMMNKGKKGSGIEIVSLNPGQPSKLRGNFYWQILIKSSGAERMCGFIKKRLKGLPRSGIITTVDIDPL